MGRNYQDLDSTLVAPVRREAQIVRPRRAGDLPVLVHVVSQRARFSDYAGPPLAISPAAALPSSHSEWSRHPGLRAFPAQWPRPPVPLSTLQETPRDVPCKTRGQNGFATSFPVGRLHPLQHAGLAPARSGFPVTRDGIGLHVEF